MLLELIVSQNHVQISYRSSAGPILLIFTYVLALIMGLIFISVSLFADHGPEEFLYFGGFFAILGFLALLKSPQQIRDMGVPTPFSANSNELKFNHRIYEPEKANVIPWARVSKLIITKKMTLKRFFFNQGSAKNRLIICFLDTDFDNNNYIKNEDLKIYRSPKGGLYTVIKFPQNYEKELQLALMKISGNSCPIILNSKVVYDYSNEVEEFVS